MPRKPTDMSIASWASSRKRIATSSKEILFENGPLRIVRHCPYVFFRVWCRELYLLIIFNPVPLAVSVCRHLRFCTEKPWDFLIEGRGGAPALLLSSGTPHVLSRAHLRGQSSIHPQLFIHPLFWHPFSQGGDTGEKCKHRLCASVYRLLIGDVRNSGTRASGGGLNMLRLGVRIHWRLEWRVIT